MLGKLFDRLLGARPWYRLPGLLAALKIIRIRNELRERNLYDTRAPFREGRSRGVWDGSQVYGANVEIASRLRTFQDGRLRIRDDEATGIDIAGVTDNWWIGLSMLHALFTREHNAISIA